ncbi:MULTISPECIES: beta-ketoacyl-ACP synthase II [Synechococcus]|jgi:3-oxoacyl-[acyl-carrier-protein] synthase II|uniref:beta-ketoacyl-ACP synthase II n=1 Tax=Synechococcus TaxID=1129 RepID=UPI0009D0AD9D|nr:MULTISPECIES: beta-ketoacyl-ACP synthase II [Synechococcus]MCF8133986.1 beta-ketoacyl-ACP synthase II [Synechococcus lacustris]OON11871.1 MAG: beta-ketoacyl-[acyl-carrier-protein] synthase II [Synechococcus lacustris str. Tous]HBU26904.1 beta-ketoacyl-[acyl-carrier-protein] synthase II [Synechococcales bacterium UBA8138]MCP9794294.1 beta-ketoacyl-ACP synthase II [Synechococcus lacustris L1F-Slac]MCP9813780.1 beta-ketoacyl-ACP synthase II [Synechococcus lacustris L1E-Slac]
MVETSRRVVITGLGSVTPIGNTTSAYWAGLCQGANGVAPITLFDASAHACRFAAEVKAFDPTGLIDPKEAKRWDRFCQFGVVAAKEALAQSGLLISDANRQRIGVIIGSGVGGLLMMESQAHVLKDKGPSRVSPFTVPMMIPNMATGLVAIALGAQGPSSAVATACAAGSNAIGDAFRLIQNGHADAMVCGGAESAITPLGVAGFASAKALSFRNNDPASASRPFDAERDGFVIGEGSGVLILESLSHAQARGAAILAEVVGYGSTCDAHHITSPTPGGAGGARAMALALLDAQLEAEQVDYVNAHGTSTPANDSNETAAIKTALGPRARQIPVSSTKSMTGHLLGGSGGIEAVAAVLAIGHGVVPPTINYQNPDPACDLDVVPNQAREQIINTALSNSFGFGGHNVCLAFRRFA